MKESFASIQNSLKSSLAADQSAAPEKELKKWQRRIKIKTGHMQKEFYEIPKYISNRSKDTANHQQQITSILYDRAYKAHNSKLE